jgi:hypothetical protein
MKGCGLMHIGIEIVVAIVFFIPIIVLLGTVGYELQIINDFSLIIEGTTRLIPFPDDFSETYFELRILGDYQFLEVGPFSLIRYWASICRTCRQQFSVPLCSKNWWYSRIPQSKVER